LGRRRQNKNRPKIENWQSYAFAEFNSTFPAFRQLWPPIRSASEQDFYGLESSDEAKRATLRVTRCVREKVAQPFFVKIDA
jgi:hypothetical protein